MDFSSNIKGLLFKICFISLICCILLWISIFSYGILYYLYIPAVAHTKPIYFKYDISSKRGEYGRNPYDNITLVEPGQSKLLRSGQSYTIEIVLEMPESERNLNQGMFMIRLDILSKEGNLISASRRPALMHYKSPLFKILYTLFYIPGLLAGSVEEKQILTISLFENYLEDNYHPAQYAFIEIEAHAAEIYSACMRIHAQFTGLRYIMYYWPVLSAIVGIGANFFSLAMFVIFIWIRQIMYASEVVSLPELSVRERQPLIRERQKLSKSKEPQKFTTPRLSPKTPKYEDVEIEDLPTHRKKKVPPDKFPIGSSEPYQKTASKDLGSLSPKSSISGDHPESFMDVTNGSDIETIPEPSETWKLAPEVPLSPSVKKRHVHEKS